MSCVQIISRKHLYPLNGQITILAFLIQDLGMLSVITPCGKKIKRLEKIPDIYSTFSKSSNFGFAPCSDFARERVRKRSPWVYYILLKRGKIAL